MQIGNLSPRQLARRYGVSVPSIYRWHREGKLPQGVRLAKRVLRFNLLDIEEWEKSKLGNDRTQHSETDVAGRSGVLSATGTDAGSREIESQGPAQRTRGTKSIFALDEPAPDLVHQPPIEQEIDDRGRSS